MSVQTLKILVCDDHALIREGLKRILFNGGIAGLVGEAANALQAMDEVRREKWSIIILDINLGGRNGMDVLKEIKAEFPKLPVLMLSNYPDEQFALRAIRAGANGYLNKNLAARVMIEAIQQVMEGGQYISPKVAEQLFNAVQHPGLQPLHHKLSDRENQLLRLIGAGRTVGEIARRLNLSVKTVSTYRTITLRKLDLKNNAQLMRYAQENELDE
jgi:DNA-binding NarL/FixJ family response regulator